MSLGFPHLRQDTQASLFQGLRILPRPVGQVARPVVHQDTPEFEQVRACIGRLHPVPNHMRQGRLDPLPGMIRPQKSLWQSLDPVLRRCGDESEQETGSPNDRGMIDGIRLWGSRRWRRNNAPLKKTWWRTQVAQAFDNHNASLSEGGGLPVVVWHFPETRHWTRNNEHFPRPLRQSEARLRLACPPLDRRGGAPHEAGCWWRAVESARKPTAKNSRPQVALRPREASLENTHNPISSIGSTGSLALRLTASDSGLILG